MKKSGGESSRLLVWLLLAALAGGGLWLYRKRVLFDEAKRSGAVEAAVDEALARAGLRDSDIHKISRRERKSLWHPPLSSWVETEREIVLPRSVRLEPLLESLSGTCAAFGLDPLQKEEGASGVSVELGKKSQIFQRLIFLAAVPALPSAVLPLQAAIVIDDVAGRPQDLQKIDDFLSLGVPLTFAVLPMEKTSAKLAEAIHKAGFEVIVHQPMEPEDLKHNNPGKAAFLVAMPEKEIRERMRRNLKSVPHAVGISNHMGSRFTETPAAMRVMLSSLSEMRGADGGRLFFFDSHTTGKVVGGRIAQELGVPHALNDIFLDNSDDLAAVERQLDLLKAETKKRGYGAAIGHIQRKHTAEAVRRKIAGLKKERIEIVPLSLIVKRSMAEPSPAAPAARPAKKAGKKKR